MKADFSPSLAAVSIRPRGRSFQIWKRVLDLSLASILALVALPLAALIGVLIKGIDGGEVIYWQRRIGQYGRPFWFPKLRSMHVGADALHELLRPENDLGDSITFKMEDDPRVTEIGRVIRRLSLDELPQLWCVLKGEMSLVGPRPALQHEVKQYTPNQLRRLEVKPGITGLWQVCGRSTIPFDGQLALDFEYIARQSWGFDLEILVRTIPAVLTCKGAW